MFVIEVLFKSPPVSREVVLVRRPTALLGASEESNVTLDELSELGGDIRLTRQLGRAFTLQPTSPELQGIDTKSFWGEHDKEANIFLDRVDLKIIALDSDLLLKDEETPDRGGVRILRQACAFQSPIYPALTVEQRGKPSFSISFAEGRSLLIGRSAECQVRIDAPEISSNHARIGHEAGTFWVEDLGSTNGTFLSNRQISSRTPFLSGQSVRLAQDVFLTGVSEVGSRQVNCDQDVRSGHMGAMVAQNTNSDLDWREVDYLSVRYPCLVSLSELCRPARIVLQPGSKIQIGREHGCDIWVGAPHVSRIHAEVSVNQDGGVTFLDMSTNGTKFDGGILKAGAALKLASEPKVFDFGEGISIAVCFDEYQENMYKKAQGSLTAFRSKLDTRHYLSSGDESVDLKPSIMAGLSKRGYSTHYSVIIGEVKKFNKYIFDSLGGVGLALVLVTLMLLSAILWLLWAQ